MSQSLRFVSTAIRSGYYKSLFSARETISSLVQGVIITNVTLREHDLEQFDDDPLEFIRLDLSISTSGTDLATRRQAAADVLQALVSSGYEAEATEIVGAWINTGLMEYGSNKNENWKAKDSAVYLLTAVATRGSTTQVVKFFLDICVFFANFSGKHGVTSTNALVDVVKFFSDHVFEDLQAAPGTVNPFLQVDAIRFLLTFRNQVETPRIFLVYFTCLNPTRSAHETTTSFCPSAPCPSPSFRKLCHIYLRRYHYRSDFVHQARKCIAVSPRDYLSTFTYGKSFVT